VIALSDLGIATCFCGGYSREGVVCEARRRKRKRRRRRRKRKRRRRRRRRRKRRRRRRRTDLFGIKISRGDCKLTKG